MIFKLSDISLIQPMIQHEFSGNVVITSQPNDVKEKLDCVSGLDSRQMVTTSSKGKWIPIIAWDISITLPLNSCCVKMLGGMFSSVTLFNVDISLKHVLPYPKSALFGHGGHINHYSVQSSFSLTSLVSTNDCNTFPFTGSRIYLLWIRPE